MGPGLTRQEPAENGTPAIDEDRAMVGAVLAGDTPAFAGLVRRCQTPLVNLAWRFCRDRGRAEEMAQEAFLRAFRNLAQWRGEATLSTGLFALAMNVYRTELRRIPATMQSLDEIAEIAPDASRRDEALRRAVPALPEK
jgi:RNA polymerase sigma-70 factor, ECF subfamily